NRFSDASGFRFTDTAAIGFVYELFSLLDQLHQSRIILGDINPGNILCDTARHRPVFLDIDAAQIGGFACWSTHDSYNDPQLRTRGKATNGTFTFDFGTDTFALAVVCFELLVGARPYQLRITPPKPETERKALGITSIRCVSLGRDH